MVGAKSLGCLECKRRKVKCDQRFPKCVNCERVRRSCSGPKSHFIRYIRPGAEEHINTLIINQCRSWKSPSSTVSERLSADLVRHLQGVDKVGYQLQWFGVFISFLPSRIGHNRALDAAVRCLLQVHQAVLCDKGIYTEGLQCYNESVALIRKELNDRQAQTTPETVCAALILSTYEIYKRDQLHGWMTHAGGVAAILESWGPGRFVSDFEMALFCSHYGSIVSSSLISGKACFLDSPEWLALRARCLKTFTGLDKSTMGSFDALATLPLLLQGIKEAKAAAATPLWPTSLASHARELKAKVARDAPKLHLDYLNPKIVSQIPSLLNPGHTVLQFSEPRVAFRYNFYWAITIVANKILLAFGEDDASLVQEYRDAAEDIIRSIEYSQTLRPLGALWLTFSASTAYGVSGETARRRIVEGVQGVHHPISISISSYMMERTFEILTGGICQRRG